jgi:hypothetical protein
MQHINDIVKFGHVDDSENALLVANPDLANTRADGIHWLPIVGLLALLNRIELVPRIFPRQLRKRFSASSESPQNSPGFSGALETFDISVLVYHGSDLRALKSRIIRPGETDRE